MLVDSLRRRPPLRRASALARLARLQLQPPDLTQFGFAEVVVDLRRDQPEPVPRVDAAGAEQHRTTFCSAFTAELTPTPTPLKLRLSTPNERRCASTVISN